MPRIIKLAFIVPFLSLALFAGQPPRWTETRSAHFSVVTDAGEKRGQEVAEHFEEMRAIFGSLILHDRVNIPVPLQIIGFHDGKEFRNFAPLFNGKPIQLAGLYQMGEDRNFILLDLSASDAPRTVYHEYAHLLLNGNYPPTQPWFDEGFAEYFSSIEIHGKQADIGRPPQDEADIFQQHRLMPVLQLFAVERNSPIYNESGDHRSMFYSESWLVVHYIFDHHLLEPMGTYFDLVENRHVAIAAAIQQAFGMSAAQFDKTIQAYLNTGRIGYATVPLPDVSSTYNSTLLSAPQAQAILADAHLHSRDYVQTAIAEFRQVLAQDPENEAAHRGLGYAYLRKQNFDAARQEFEQAVRLNSGDPRALFYYAMLSQQKAAAEGVAPANLGEMATDLHHSIQLDPTFAPSYGLLSFVELSQGSPSAALATITKALAMDQRNEQFLFQYAQVLVASRDYDNARAVLSKLQASSDQQLALRANSLLFQLQSHEESAQSSAPVMVREDQNGGGGDSQKIDESTPDAADAAHAVAPPQAPAADPSTPILFLKGTLLSADCSAPPAATITVRAGARTWQMHTADSKRIVLIGAEAFSCAWKNQKVAVNYRATGAGSGQIVSLEIQ